MRFDFFKFLCLLILSTSSFSPKALAAPSDPASIDSLIECAKACARARVPYDLIFHDVIVEQDLFEVRIILISCDEEYFWYEGVCGHTEERQAVAFSRIDGSLLRGPKGCLGA